MLDKFINAYKAKFFKIFTDDFYGHFKAYENAITEPKFHPSLLLKNELSNLDRFIQEPLTIAIVGQFSSGKSTFLNALLGREILPTGLTPVTAKPTLIKYGENYLLRVLYKNQKELDLDVNQIAKFVDQRVFGDDVQSLSIYAPREILREVNFIDTPGLNSLSDADTGVTKSVLQDVGAIIWISLIDNAGRASELAQIRTFLENGGKKAICVLNQKDKLSSDELERVLQHCKKTYGEFFDEVLAISAKQALLSLKNKDENLMQLSNFNSIFESIKEKFAQESTKENFVLQKCQEIDEKLLSQHENFIKIYEKAENLILKFDENLNGDLDMLKEKFSPKIELAFNEIKRIAKEISDEILASLLPQKQKIFTPKKSLISKQIYQKNEYEMLDINTDSIFSKLIYNDVKFDKSFKIYRRNLQLLQDEINANLLEIFGKIKKDFMLYKAEFENLTKECPIHSETEFATLRTYAGQVYELFLRGYESGIFKQTQKIALFFERLSLKVATNYDKAVQIAVFLIKEKIELAKSSYEKDPVHFSLYVPTSNEVYERVLLALNIYEFQSEMLSNVSFLNKALVELKSDFAELSKENLSKIQRLCKRHKKLKNELEKIKFQG
ncbi:MAG: dynamin family protein [Campylobacter sp.]|nr:dynamin family protein [Campylobacter sp.]